MKHLAFGISILGFFVLAGVGWANGLSVEDCALKAGAGAVAIFIVARQAGKMIANIIAEVITEATSGNSRNRFRDSGN